MKHYIAMNGSVGCLPDNIEVHDTKESAIESMLALFDDYPDREEVETELAHTWIFYFPSGYGADYVEIIEEDCIGIENGCEYHDNDYTTFDQEEREFQNREYTDY